MGGWAKAIQVCCPTLIINIKNYFHFGHLEVVFFYFQITQLRMNNKYVFQIYLCDLVIYHLHIYAFICVVFAIATNTAIIPNAIPIHPPT